MSISFFGRRAGLLLLSCPIVIGVMGSDCTIGLPGGVIVDPPPVVVDDFVHMDLVNVTDFDVDPGLFFNDEYVDVGDVFAQEDFPVDVECFLGDQLVIDPLFHVAPGVDEASDGAPFLEEGVEFFCGDDITVFYDEDDAGFFVDVEVNGELLDF